MQHLHTQTSGQHFTSNSFQNLTDMLGVDKRCTTPYHMESNGVIQRINCTLKNILAKFLNKNQSDWNLWLPHEHIRRLYIHPQMSRRITCFLGEKLVYLSWPDSGRQSWNKTPSKCPNVCTRYENKLLAREIAAHRYKDYYDAKAVENPNQVGDRGSALKHVCGRAYVIIKKISDAVCPLQKDFSNRKCCLEQSNNTHVVLKCLGEDSGFWFRKVVGSQKQCWH